MATVKEWDERHLKLAFEVSKWSKDPSHKVGAIIVDQERRPVSWGYNGLATGIEDSPAILGNRDVKYKYILHAEKNAILFARRSLDHCVLYSTLPPCAQCTAALVQLHIYRIVCNWTEDYMSRWKSDVDAAKHMCQQVGILYRLVPSIGE